MTSIHTYINEALTSIDEASLSEIPSTEVETILKKYKMKYVVDKKAVFLYDVKELERLSDELAGSKLDVVYDDQAEKVNGKDMFKLVLFK